MIDLSVLDLAPVPHGSTPGDALRHSRDLAQHAEVAPADTFIFLHENDYSDWSVGGGVAAMALVQQTGGVERQA